MEIPERIKKGLEWLRITPNLRTILEFKDGTKMWYLSLNFLPLTLTWWMNLSAAFNRYGSQTNSCKLGRFSNKLAKPLPVMPKYLEKTHYLLLISAICVLHR